MNTYILHVLVGGQHRVDRVEADSVYAHRGCYEFVRNPKEKGGVIDPGGAVAYYPMDRTIIFRIDKP